MKNEIFDFCWDHEGYKWRGVEWMHTMHFDAFAIHILLIYQIFFILELIIFWICKSSVFSFLFHFGVVRYVVRLPNYYLEDFFYSQWWQHGTNLWFGHKKLLRVLDIYVGIKILEHFSDFTKCLRCISKTFPTKLFTTSGR